MKMCEAYMIECFFCGHKDTVQLDQCADKNTAKEQFTSEGWAVETINGYTGNACPDCRTVNGYLKITTEAF